MTRTLPPAPCPHRRAPYSPTLDRRVCAACFTVLPAGRNKYGARRTQVDGVWLDSQAEARYYQVLRERERRGEIRDLVVHPRFVLSVGGLPICTYVADFSFVQAGTPCVVDVKGVRTPAYVLKRKLMQAVLGITVHEVTDA